MISTKELRIENYVFSKSDMFPTQINSIFSSNVKLWCNPLAMFHETEIEPIPLTEEMLLKCGFVKALGVFNIECCKSILYLRLAYDKGFYYGINSSDCNSCEFDDVISIKHLHQLQNLYFALTGQELEVSL